MVHNYFEFIIFYYLLTIYMNTIILGISFPKNKSIRFKIYKVLFLIVTRT